MRWHIFHPRSFAFCSSSAWQSSWWKKASSLLKVPMEHQTLNSVERAWRHQYMTNTLFIFHIRSRTFNSWIPPIQLHRQIYFPTVGSTRNCTVWSRVHLVGFTMKPPFWRLRWPCSTFPVSSDQLTLPCATPYVHPLAAASAPILDAPTHMCFWSTSSWTVLLSSSISRPLHSTLWSLQFRLLGMSLERGWPSAWTFWIVNLMLASQVYGWNTGRIFFGEWFH